MRRPKPGRARSIDVRYTSCEVSLKGILILLATDTAFDTPLVITRAVSSGEKRNDRGREGEREGKRKRRERKRGRERESEYVDVELSHSGRDAMSTERNLISDERSRDAGRTTETGLKNGRLSFRHRRDIDATII